ncbi:MAG: amidohydrolase family protein [bacterium]|nr:amidohydrolase family protein [bacterium]
MIRLMLTLALVGGTVHTGTGPAIENATLLIEGNRVEAVGTDLSIPADAERIDVRGRIITPGFVDASSRLGVNEVSLEASSVEATLPKDHDPIRAALRVVDTFNPASFTLPAARAAGITSAVVMPSGGLVSGVSIWADLIEEQPVRSAALALHVNVGSGRGRGSRSVAFLRLREAFQDARVYHGNRGPYIARRLRNLSVSAADVEVLRRALDGELPVVFAVDRASDIETVLAFAREHRLSAVLSGAAEGWRVADAIAKAKVPVIVNPLLNLPSSFSRLQSRSDNALRLHQAGVRVVFAQAGASHLAHRLRHIAGVAVANNYPPEAAMAAITRNPARVFGMKDTGTLRKGALANLVVWNGDPFELTTWAERVFVRGVEVDLQTRQDLLTERYRPVTTPPETP